jgi:hypothetical protein
MVKQAPNNPPISDNCKKCKAMTLKTSTSPNMNLYPNSYFEAMNSAERHDWWKAMCTEFKNAEIRGFWEIVSKHNVPKEWKL